MNLLKQLFGSPLPTLDPVEAQARLASAGYRVINLKGGMPGWGQSRLPLDR